jgi:ubiquinone/menaquinone biosynthesis C-methylase UbiE
MRPSKETFEEWNEEHARKHDLDKFYSHPNSIFRYIENKRIKTLINFAQISDNHLVLEAGCGIGNILERIKQGRLFGIDISAIQIERAKKRLGSRVEFIRSPAENTPFGDRYFDRIICTEVFEHVLDPSLVLLEMKRILKDKGIISLSIPNEKLINFTKKFLLNFGMKRILEPKKSNWDLASKNNLDEWHLHNYSLKLIKQQVKNQFKIDEIRRIPFFFVPFRYVLNLKKIL